MQKAISWVEEVATRAKKLYVEKIRLPLGAAVPKTGLRQRQRKLNPKTISAKWL